jgi:excisionase family DNA binding protein
MLVPARDNLLTTKEAATALGYTIQHTRLLIRQGQLPGTKIGRDWYVDKRSIQSYLNTSQSSLFRESAFDVEERSAVYQLSCDFGELDHWQHTQQLADFTGDDYALICADARDAVHRLPAETIQSCLTSPPYWMARDYEHPDQIGLESRIEEYVHNLVMMFRGIRRVLRKDGTLWINLGDCYLNSQSSVGLDWQRNKQLGLTPFRLAIALQEDGWLVRNTLVWHKPNAMPASVRDRLSNTWEPILLLTKSEQYFFNLDAIRVPHKTDDSIERKRAEEGEAEGKAAGSVELRRWLNSPRHRATIDGLKEIRRRPNAPKAVELTTYLRAALEAQEKSIKWVAGQLDQPFERIRHYFRTDKIGARLPPEDTWQRLKEILSLDTKYDDAMEIEVGDNVFRNHPNGRNPGDMQSVSLARSKYSHYAMMPEKLAKWCLSATLRPGSICLDPFMGLGTTAIATREQNAKFVGIDLRQDYLSLAKDILDQTREMGSGYLPMN